MRFDFTWYRLGLAAVTLLAACAPGDRSNTPNGPSLDASAAAAAAGTILLQEPFEDNAFASRGWYDNTNLITTTAQHASGSTRALELHYTAGSTMPTSGGSARYLFAATPTLYVSYWVKYSANWVGSGRAYHPHEFLILSDQDGNYDGPSNNWLTAYIEHNYQNGGIPRLALQDNKAINTSAGALPFNLAGTTENRSIGGCNGVVESNVVATCFNMPPWYNDKEFAAPQVSFRPDAGPGYKGDWNRVEVYFQMNSVVGGIGQADGVMQYWFNGTLVIDRHDVQFRTGARPTIQFHQFLIGPYIGDGSPVDQSMWVDNLTLATARIADTPVTEPGTVTGLSVAAVTSNSVTLSFVEVNDGTGQPAKYDIRSTAGPIAWGSAPEVAQGTCQTPVAGTAIGAVRTCTVLGLAPSTSYQFQLIPYRGTLNVDAVFGALSNVANGTTAAAPLTPVASVTLSPATASLVVAGTQQLVATLKSASGTVLTGRAVTWASSNPAVATTSASGLVTGVAAGTATITATSEGISGTATVTVPTTTTKPGTVTNLAVAGVTSNSVTLSFTEVTGGTGLPASYQVRWAVGTMSWSSATVVTQGTCTAPVVGVAIGAARTCTVQGLTPATSYRFQIRAFRGTLNVNAVWGALSNVASGTTTAVPLVPVASVIVSPASFSVTTGQTAQFVATPRDASGNVLTGRVVTWVSSNTGVETVNGSGLVTGIAIGLATITATIEGKAASSVVTVTQVPAPPPPSGAMWPNEPAGWRSVTDYGFNDAIPIGADVPISAGWSVVNATGRITRITDATAPVSPSTVARIFYPAGFVAGSQPGTLYYPQSGTKDHYVGYEFKLSNPYSNNVVGSKQWYPYSSTANYFMLFGSDSKMWMYVQADGSHGGSYNLSGNVNNPTITLGAWHRIEILQRYPTTSSSNDGVFRWWIDGVLCGNYTNVGWSTTSTYQELRFAPTWGGISGSVAFDSYLQIDHIHISRP